MKIGTRRFDITLDWDNLTWSEFGFRLNWIIDRYGYEIEIIRWRMSSSKGFHVKIIWKFAIDALKMRQHLKDDGKRIVGDIFREKEHDILWQEKIYGNVEYKAGSWITAFDSELNLKCTDLSLKR